MNKKEVRKAPVLRFKGFTDDWEQHTLGDFGSVAMNKRIFKNQTTDKGDVPFFKISTFGKKADSFISNNLFEKYKEKYPYPQKGDLLISASGSIGRIVEYKGQKAYYQDSNIVWLNHNKELLNIYLKAYYQIIHWHGIEGSTIKRLYNKNILATSIFVPDKKEQYELGKLIKKAEKIISLQQRKLRLLKLLKKATQQNIFASTECLPKLKYRNLTGKWQLYRLKDVAKITMGQSPNSKNYTQNPIDHILVQGNADIRNGYVFPRIWTTEITKIANRGDIILCVRAPAGDVGRTKFNVVIGRGVAAIKGNDFIFQQLQFMKSSGYWKKYIRGSTFESINSNDIKNAKIFCPSQLEQKNISSLLDDIDTSIQNQQKNILDFKYIKQFLLQNMFI
ncbi:restriction endonuclease subunit S [Lactobacillus helveticus]|uniref:restriction endonuclease subunit S n=2 Tax=Lactobacillus helveticus TaxID=1587 RepID=UPI0030CE6941